MRVVLIANGPVCVLFADTKTQEIELKAIETETLQKVIAWMEYHKLVPPKPIEKPLQSNSLRDLVDTFDADFAENCSQELMFKILLVRRRRPALLLNPCPEY